MVAGFMRASVWVDVAQFLESRVQVATDQFEEEGGFPLRDENRNPDLRCPTYSFSKLLERRLDDWLTKTSWHPIRSTRRKA
jgi:hypothetical protein